MSDLPLFVLVCLSACVLATGAAYVADAYVTMINANLLSVANSGELFK